ncbi:MAG: hypothetical protein WCL22_03975 [bacterium]
MRRCRLSAGCLPSTAANQFKGVLSQAKIPFQEVATPFPAEAESIIVLRSTLLGGSSLVQKVFSADGKVCWQAGSNQAQAKAQQDALRAWRAHRSINLA